MADNKVDDNNHLAVDLAANGDRRTKETGKLLANHRSVMSEITREGGYGDWNSQYGSTLYGNNLIGTPLIAPQVDEHAGLTFFTRPLLNLSYDNLKADRRLFNLVTDDSRSMQAYIRATLDVFGKFTSPLVDNRNPFIPLLSNTLVSLAGWRDPILNSKISEPGRLQNQHAHIDSSNIVAGHYPLSISFHNLRDNPVTKLLYIWETYASLNKEGVIRPYPEFIRHHKCDYQSRIYRLILDPSRRFVEQVINCYYCYPITSALGISGNLNLAEPINQEVTTTSQTFDAIGAEYYDTASVYDFNVTSTIMHPDLREPERRKNNMRRLWPSEYAEFNYRAYPLIDEDTSELHWYVMLSDYKRIKGNVSYPPYTGVKL